jgi:hypothetical protein
MISESLGRGGRPADVKKVPGQGKMETALWHFHRDFYRRKIELDTAARKGYNPALKKASKR